MRKSSKGVLAPVRETLRLLRLAEWTVYIVLKLALTLLPLALTYATQRIVDMDPETSRFLWLAGTSVLCLLLVQAGNTLFLNRMSHSLELRMKEQLLNGMKSVRLNCWETAEAYDGAAAAWQYAAQAPQTALYLLDTAVAAVSILVTGAYLFGVSPLLAAGIIVGFIPLFFLNLRFGFEKYFTEIGQVRDYRRNWYLTKLAFDRQSNQEMRHFRLFPLIAERQEQVNRKLNQAMFAIARKHFLLQLPAFSLVSLTYVCSLVYCVLRAQQLGYGIVAVLFSVLGMLSQFMLALSTNFEKLTRSSHTATHGLSSLRTLPQDETQTLKSPFVSLKADDVSFRYPGADRDAVSSLGLEIQAGQKVMIVGENGSGKTTLMKLLLGLYAPDSGSIVCNGAHSSLRGKAGVLFQNYLKLDATVFDNVDMGRGFSEEEVLRALARAGLNEWTDEFNLHTTLGDTKGATDLSGGQWQRIAIARALLGDPSVIFMDEPTASLDPKMESDLFRLMASLPVETTLVCISHRLGLTRKMDRIYVMSDGKITESGTHQELIEQQGLFSAMFAAQAGEFQK